MYTARNVLASAWLPLRQTARASQVSDKQRLALFPQRFHVASPPTGRTSKSVLHLKNYSLRITTHSNLMCSMEVLSHSFSVSCPGWARSFTQVENQLWSRGPSAAPGRPEAVGAESSWPSPGSAGRVSLRVASPQGTALPSCPRICISCFSR